MSATTITSPNGGTDTANAVLARELAVLQARADLDAAQRAASMLTADGLRDLRAWIDARLCAVIEPAFELNERAGGGHVAADRAGVTEGDQ